MSGKIPEEMPADTPMTARPVILALAIFAGLLGAATAALWFHYGTAVFYETIVAGLNACF